MRAFPITVLNGGINRLRVKGGAAANQLYDLQNAWITNAGAVVPREGTIRAATLDSSTVGLAAANGQFNIFSSAFSTATLPANYVLNVLSDPSNTSASPTVIYYAKPFMGFLYVVASFSDGTVHHYWLQNSGTWTSSTDYTSASIVLPPTPNGLAYQGVRDFPIQPLWTAETLITSGSYVEPNTPTGFAYQAVATTGSPVHTGQVEPVWPTLAGGIIQEFGDFDLSASDAGTTQASLNGISTASPLGSNITDRYGDSQTISNAGVFASSSTLSTLTLASTKITTWKAGTLYAPGSVVIPTSNQGAFINAIPNGDFEGGSGAGGWTFTDPGGSTEWTYSSTLPYQGTECITFPGGGAAAPGAAGAFATMTSYSLVTPGQSVTATAYLDPNNSGANLTLWLQINWYNTADSIISSSGWTQNEQEGGGYRQVSVTGIAPAGAAHARVAIGAGSGTTSRNAGFADLVSWNLATPAPITNFLFEAVQPTAGSSAATEPTWPTVLGNEVIDGTVTWQAIGTSIITWQAIPLMQSGLVAPTFPTTIGNTVHDYSTYSNINGYITTFSSMSWVATDRHISDPKDPNTIAVAIGASHVFAGDNDIVDYSAAVDPTDWTSTNNAGYLPTGLNNYGDNPVAALALYRGNLIVFNAGGYQMWQIDPDPQNMAFLDAQPVGSIYTRAAQSVANDLLFLTEVGVRNLGTIGATANMAIGNTGQPVDPLIKAQLSGIPIYTPVGGIDPYAADVALLLHCDGSSGSLSFPDSSPNNLILVNNGDVAVTTVTPEFGSGAASFVLSSYGQLTYAVSTGSALDMGTGPFTVEFWFRWNGALANSCVCGVADTSGDINWAVEMFRFGAGSDFVRFYLNTTGGNYTVVTTGTTFVANTWYSVAAVYTGGTAGSMYVFLNGVPGAGPTIVTGAPKAPYSQFNFGGIVSFAFNAANTEVDEFRLTKGVARYTSAYTPATQAFPGAIPAYTPISLYYPGRGQYWLMFGPQAFVLTINGLNGTKTWARYIFPDTITDWTLNAGILYLRTKGNLVWQLDAGTIGVDDSTAVIASATNTTWSGLMQWPYLDMGTLGRNKMMVGVDLVGEGECFIQVAYNQNDKTTFNDNPLFSSSTNVTAPYLVTADDTVPGTPLPIPINAPSYSVILTFPGSATTPNQWSWEASNIYITDASGGGAMG
jgi:concanavalin A-like lectin/glucanase superfamily protein